MHIVLLTTPTCIKCKSLKPKLMDWCEKKNLKLDIVDATESKGRFFVDTYQISQVPTVFLYDDSGSVAKIISGEIYLEDIENWYREYPV